MAAAQALEGRVIEAAKGSGTTTSRIAPGGAGPCGTGNSAFYDLKTTDSDQSDAQKGIATTRTESDHPTQGPHTSAMGWSARVVRPKVQSPVGHYTN